MEVEVVLAIGDLGFMHLLFLYPADYVPGVVHYKAETHHLNWRFNTNDRSVATW